MFNLNENVCMVSLVLNGKHLFRVLNYVCISEFFQNGLPLAYRYIKRKKEPIINIRYVV